MLDDYADAIDPADFETTMKHAERSWAVAAE